MDVSELSGYPQLIWEWFKVNLLNMSSLCQLGVVALLLLVSLGVGVLVRRACKSCFESPIVRDDFLGRLARAVDRVWWLVVFVALISVAKITAVSLSLGERILDMASGLALAWIVIRLASGLLASGTLRRTVGWVAWTLAALHIVGLLSPVLVFLDSVGTTFGETRISLLMLIKGTALLLLLLKGVGIVNTATASRLEKAEGLSPSLQVLFAKLVKLSLYTFAFLMSVSAVGVDLTSLAVLSGAMGVGIGFGLRQIFANLVSGVLLLMDRAVKPGDVIELDGTRGEVTAINIRYSVVRTRDGKEYILPNESLVTQQVVLWTHQDPVVRLRVPVGIHYESDPRLAMRLMEEAVQGISRVLPNPSPGARLIGFGDSSVNLELRVWINDAEQGVVNVQSEILLAIWDLFKEHGVTMPYPQRDVYIKELPASIVQALETGNKD